ncbi:Fe(3+)-hydroxamate ABC transporter permease FhuB [Azorhizobium caulinodans]|uniref:Fe(3+)-hydroxamate ABC transporter permease FhuB n=1 Tax=Azorhizobium caulinodans TaxID=7 RepID=UPI002FBF00E7
MAEAVSRAGGRPTTSRDWAFGIAGLLLLSALLLLGLACARLVPPGAWLSSARTASDTDIPGLLVREALLPRFCVSLLAGAALGLSGMLFQQVLRNPLAEPGTLGIFAGARLAGIAAMVLAPGLLALGPEPVALAGGAASFLLVALIGARRRFAPMPLILGGLVVTFYCEGLAQTFILFNHDALTDLFIWQAGSLSQNNWAVARVLLGVLALGAVLTVPLRRALAAFELDEGGARALGLSVGLMRAAALAVAMGLAIGVMACVGAIGFVGLAAPAIARASGSSSIGQRLWQAPLLGGALLALTDQVVQATLGADAPTGAVTALLGAPLLLWPLRRVRAGGAEAQGASGSPHTQDDRAELSRLGWLLAGLLLVSGAALSLGRLPDGWSLSLGGAFSDMLPWRGPRVAAAAASGALFGFAGHVLQRATANPLASPELLGVSAGAGLGLLVGLLVLPTVSPGLLLGSTVVGALAILAVMAALARRADMAPDQVLIAGVALSALLSALGGVVLYTGDPRMVVLAAWLSGSTYGVTTPEALRAGGIAAVCLLALFGVRRWLDILPLGWSLARALGAGPAGSRLLLLGLAALATAAGTLLTGPLSFTGLMAPHMARLMGFRRAVPQGFAAALGGALLMVLADWIGRTIAFPWQVPAGVVASLIGGSYLLWLMARRPQ